MKKNNYLVNLIRRLRQEKSLASETEYLAYSKGLRRLYKKYSARELMLRDTTSLDIGSGENPRNPFGCDFTYGVDIRDNPSKNIIAADLVLNPIPFDSNFFDYVTAFDFLEHIPRLIYCPNRRLPFVELMNEIYRVLKPGGLFFSHTPIYPYASAFRDPTHVNIITVETFPLYFGDQNHWADIYGFSGQFKILHQTIKRPHLVSILQKA